MATPPKVPKTVKLETYFASRMSVRPDGRCALVSGELGAMFLVDLDHWKAAPWCKLPGAPGAIEYSPDGTKVALSFASMSGANESVEVRDAKDGALLVKLDARDPSQASAVVEALSFSPDGARILGVSSSAVDKDAAHAVLFDVEKRTAKHVRVGAHSQLVAAFVDDRTALALTSRKVQPDDCPDTDVFEIDAETSALVRIGDGAMDVVKSLRRLADGQLFATASYSPARVLRRDGTTVFAAGDGGLAWSDGARIITMDSRKNLALTLPDGSTKALGKAAKASFAMSVASGHLLLLQEQQIQVLPAP